MLCEKCKKNTASVYYRETVNGKTKSWSLCRDCAAELEKKGEIKLDTGSFFNDSLDDWFGGSLFGNLFAPVRSTQALPDEKRCSLCGSTFEDLMEEGKAGCPKCYETFAEELEDSIRRIHGSTAHEGRVPSRLKDRFDRKKKIAEAEKQLKEAIRCENFEEAARLRDELKTLKQDGTNGEATA